MKANQFNFTLKKYKHYYIKEIQETKRMTKLILCWLNF